MSYGTVVPLFADERDYELKNGMFALLEKLVEHTRTSNVVQSENQRCWWLRREGRPCDRFGR